MSTERIINDKLKQVLRRIASVAPPTLLQALRYPAEHALMRGRLRASNDASSVFFFTTQKCASTLMRDLLADINQRHLGLVHVNLAAYFWDTRPESFYVEAQSDGPRMFRERGVLYAPLRQHVDISHLSDARVVCMLRDPRDVVVSGYYSARISHRAPSNTERRSGFEANRAHALQQSIDEFAIEYAGRMSQIYSHYQRAIPRACVLTYETMWHDFDPWLDALAALLGVRLTAEERLRYRAMAGVDEGRVENVRAHRRRGVPGDHVEKLQPETVSTLNRMFADALRWLYP